MSWFPVHPLPDKVHVVRYLLRRGGFQARSVSALFTSDQQHLRTAGSVVTVDALFGNNRGWAAPSFRLFPSSSTSNSRDSSVDVATGAELALHHRCLVKHRSAHLFTRIVTEKTQLRRRRDLSGTPRWAMCSQNCNEDLVTVIHGPQRKMVPKRPPCLCQSVLVRSMACRSSGLDAVLITRLVEIAGTLPSAEDNRCA